jgi:hypothetical protein
VGPDDLDTDMTCVLLEPRISRPGARRSRFAATAAGANRADQDRGGVIGQHQRQGASRYEVERLFRRLSGYRRIFSRLEKLDVPFAAVIDFALIADGLRLR